MRAPSSAAAPALLPRLLRASELAFAAVAAIAAATLWGWALDVPALRDFGASFPPLGPAGAIALLLLACSFFAARRHDAAVAAGIADARNRRDARLAALLAAFIAVLSLVEATANTRLGTHFALLPSF